MSSDFSATPIHSPLSLRVRSTRQLASQGGATTTIVLPGDGPSWGRETKVPLGRLINLCPRMVITSTDAMRARSRNEPSADTCCTSRHAEKSRNSAELDVGSDASSGNQSCGSAVAKISAGPALCTYASSAAAVMAHSADEAAGEGDGAPVIEAQAEVASIAPATSQPFTRAPFVTRPACLRPPRSRR